MIDQQTLEGLRRRGRRFTELLGRAEQAAGSTDQKKLRQKIEQFQAQINQANKIIPSLSPADKKKKIAAVKPISAKIAELKKQLQASAILRLPNPPATDVPNGDDDTENVVEKEVGQKPKIADPKEYLALTENLGVIDVQRAAKVSGSRFGYVLGDLAEMEFGLVQYAQAVILKHGFTMVVPPVMIKEENMAAMGYLAGGGESETYHFAKDHLYLVGTSEQSIGPMHRDELFSEPDLPKRYLAFSTCFRREAGSYGKDTKGILRVHQFDKLEMFSLTLPEDSDQEHHRLLRLQEELMQGLGLPYRVVKLCTGDLGWPSARTYDIETWMPGQGVYRETHSTSTTTDYQSRALNIRVQRADGSKQYVHMLNGTAIAVGRMLIAIVENYQRSDGRIDVPKVLQRWMRTKRIGK